MATLKDRLGAELDSMTKHDQLIQSESVESQIRQNGMQILNQQISLNK